MKPEMNERRIEARTEALDVRPVLCLSDFLHETNSTMPDGGDAREFSFCCQQWPHLLNCLCLSFSVSEGAEIPGLLFIYLPESVERLVSDAWRRSPSQGYLLHNLAQKLCREAMGLILPEATTSGCAPVPRLGRAEEAALRQALAAPGSLASQADRVPSGTLPGMGRVYSLLTYYPYLGQCACCALNETCPKLHHS